MSKPLPGQPRAIQASASFRRFKNWEAQEELDEAQKARNPTTNFFCPSFFLEKESPWSLPWSPPPSDEDRPDVEEVFSAAASDVQRQRVQITGATMDV
jgi:hypothetical protein